MLNALTLKLSAFLVILLFVYLFALFIYLIYIFFYSLTVEHASVCVPRQRKTVHIIWNGIPMIVNVCVSQISSVHYINLLTQITTVCVYNKSVELEQLRSKFLRSAVESLTVSEEPRPRGPTVVLTIHRLTFSIFSLDGHYIRDLSILSWERVLRVRDFLSSRHHSTPSFGKNVVEAGKSYQMLVVLSFCDRERA